MNREKHLSKIAFQAAKRTGLLNILGGQINKRLPKIVRITDEITEVTPRILELAKAGSVPEIVVGHFSHLDPVVGSELCQRLVKLAADAGIGENMTGFAVTIASSVPNGRQSKLMEAMYGTVEEYVNTRNVELFPITRIKDQRVYGMGKGYNELRPLIHKLRQKGVGAMIFPGGTVQAGRHPQGASGNEIFGLQKVEGNDLLEVYGLMERSGRHIGQVPYFLPIGVDKTYLLFSSDKLRPTVAGIASLYPGFSRLLSFGSFEQIVVDIRVGMPLTADDMKSSLGADWKKNSQDTNDFLMKKVAELLPPHARGYYSSW